MLLRTYLSDPLEALLLVNIRVMILTSGVINMVNIQQQLGSRLRTFRLIREYSIEELAHKAGLNPAHLGKIERGERNFTIQSLDRIVKALGISYAALFSFEDKIPPVENPTILKTVSYLTEMTAKEQEHIYRTVQMLSSKK